MGIAPPRGAPLRDRFAEEYPKDLNATQAAIRAGYAPRGARSAGMACLQDPRVKAKIDAALAARRQRCELEADAVLQELALLVFSDPAHYTVTDDGEFRLAPGAPPNAMRAIAGVDHTVVTNHATGEVRHLVKYRFYDKNAAIEKAMKHLGILTERLQVQATLEVNVTATRERIAGRLAAIAGATS